MKPTLRKVDTDNRIALFENDKYMFNIWYDLHPNGHAYIQSCNRLEIDLKEIESYITKSIDAYLLALNSKPSKKIEKDNEDYSKYSIDVSDLNKIDVYVIHERFKVEDFSGRIHHASKKLLLAGNRTGGKPKYKDIKEARDTLTKWLIANGHE